MPANTIEALPCWNRQPIIKAAVLIAVLCLGGPAFAETPDSAPAVTILRGSSAPPLPPSVVVPTAAVRSEVVYVPTYYPAYTLYPVYFLQTRPVVRRHK